MGKFHLIARNFNGKRVGILWNRPAKGAGWPPCPPSVSIPASCSSPWPCRGSREPPSFEKSCTKPLVLRWLDAAIHQTLRFTEGFPI